jgi:signal transduction histidine kinase
LRTEGVALEGAESGDALVDARAAFTRMQREQRDLIQFVVHDLKTPLSIVWANIALAREAVSPQDARLIELLGEAGEAARRLRRMIEDLLIISRLEETHFPLQQEMVSISDLMRVVIDSYARQAREKNVQLSLPGLIDVRAKVDPKLLQRVLENLVDNSLRYVPQDGRVAVAASMNDEIEIAVSNNGPAIPLAERRRVFEKFAQGSTTHAAAGNAGLGLYFCKRAIEAHGGRIDVVETDEWPTSFLIHLPRAAA